MSKYIVIEGLIGVGKTSLCRILREALGARLVLEPADDNPFLKNFYADRDRFAFPTQMFYLATRYSQQASLRQTQLFDDLVVADYLFEKDQLFAEQTLTGHELSLYELFAAHLSAGVVQPDFVLFMDSSTESILKRISRRAIQAESVIPPSYLDSLREAYYGLWSRYRGAPVYVLNTEEINYIDSEEDREAILGMIRGWLSGQPVPGAPASIPIEREAQPGLFGPGAFAE